MRSPRIRTRTLVLYFSWTSISMVYYGVALNSPNLSADRYLWDIFTFSLRSASAEGKRIEWTISLEVLHFLLTITFFNLAPLCNVTHYSIYVNPILLLSLYIYTFQLWVLRSYFIFCFPHLLLHLNTMIFAGTCSSAACSRSRLTSWFHRWSGSLGDGWSSHLSSSSVASASWHLSSSLKVQQHYPRS